MVREASANAALACKIGNGALAGICGVSASFPLDLVKTRFQLNKHEYKGKFINAFRAVKAERGLIGLYGGIHINLALITPEKAIKLVVNDKMRSALSEKDGSISIRNQVVAGATAGACQCVITSPMEMFKIAGQTGQSLKDAYIQKTAGKGPIGIYTGFCSTLVRDIPFSMVYFPLYATICDSVTPKGEDRSPLITTSAGLISGLLSALMVTPMDCIKTRIQRKGGISWMTAAKDVYAEGGVQALFNGGLARGIVVGVLFAAAQVTYEIAPCERFMGYK